MNDLTIMTHDPSLTGWGWAIIQRERVIASGCIKTEPTGKKMRIRKSDDRSRRMQEINQELLRQIRFHDVNFMVSEAPHGSQSAVAAVMIGMTLGCLQTMSDCLGIPVEWYSEGECKKSVLGKISASKGEMISAIYGLYELRWTGVKYKDEAMADAMAVYHCACRHSDTLRFLNL